MAVSSGGEIRRPGSANAGGISRRIGCSLPPEIDLPIRPIVGADSRLAIRASALRRQCPSPRAAFSSEKSTRSSLSSRTALQQWQPDVVPGVCGLLSRGFDPEPWYRVYPQVECEDSNHADWGTGDARGRQRRNTPAITNVEGSSVQRGGSGPAFESTTRKPNGECGSSVGRRTWGSTLEEIRGLLGLWADSVIVFRSRKPCPGDA